MATLNKDASTIQLQMGGLMVYSQKGRRSRLLAVATNTPISHSVTQRP